MVATIMTLIILGIIGWFVTLGVMAIRQIGINKRKKQETSAEKPTTP